MAVYWLNEVVSEVRKVHQDRIQVQIQWELEKGCSREILRQKRQ